MSLKLKVICLCLSSLFATQSFADATSTAGANAGASAGAVSQSGGGSGGQGGQGGLGVATAGVNQLNALSNQAGATGNTTSTSLTFGGTAIPANTTATNTIRTTMDGTQTIRNVPSMGAPGLTTTLTETCMGSSSGGLSIAGFGITGGSTWKDDNCVNRLNAREVRTFGPEGALAAKEIMCENKVVRVAYQRSGHPCFGDRAIIASDESRDNTAAVQGDSNVNIASNVQAKEEKSSWSSLPEASDSDQGHSANTNQWWQKKLSHKP